MRKNSKSGLTLIALLVIIIFIGIVIGIDRRSVAQLEAMAKEHAEKLYGRDAEISASCVQADTDNNGYGSCDTVIILPDGQRLIMSLECAVGSGNHGCKTRTPY